MSIDDIKNSVFVVEGFRIEIEGSVVSSAKYYKRPARNDLQLTAFIADRLVNRYRGITKVTAFDGLGRVANGNRILRTLRNSYTPEAISYEYIKNEAIWHDLLMDEEAENKLLKKKIRSMKKMIEKIDTFGKTVNKNEDIDPYDVFQMPLGTSADDLLNQYRRRAALLHPDKVDHLDQSIKDFASARTSELNIARIKLVEMGVMK